MILALLGVSSALSPSTYLTPGDKERLKLVLEPAWSLSDLAQVLYASAGYKHLGQPIPNPQVHLEAYVLLVQQLKYYLCDYTQ